MGWCRSWCRFAMGLACVLMLCSALCQLPIGTRGTRGQRDVLRYCAWAARLARIWTADLPQRVTQRGNAQTTQGFSGCGFCPAPASGATCSVVPKGTSFYNTLIPSTVWEKHPDRTGLLSGVPPGLALGSSYSFGGCVVRRRRGSASAPPSPVSSQSRRDDRR